jgi:hypothetical protein
MPAASAAAAGCPDERGPGGCVMGCDDEAAPGDAGVPDVAASTLGRYWTTPSSARARRSSKSRRLEIDSSRILRFLTSMPSLVVSRTRLCMTS